MKKSTSGSTVIHRLGTKPSKGLQDQLRLYGNSGAVVFRSTRTSVDGEHVVVKFSSSQGRAVARETSKIVRAMVSTPISQQQREKAIQLAKKVREAKKSTITAKFRNLSCDAF